MPLYEYLCEEGCGQFEAWKSIAERDQRVACPHCDQAARRIFSPPRVLSSSLRLKQENPEPILVRRTEPPMAPQLTSRSGRPWMVMH
ncbi:MAG: zinc ribbon domain-containing protein [Synechococcales bacterium]|nr:zinc ribbon domain-containing protein [Synechococcales bacterium]